MRRRPDTGRFSPEFGVKMRVLVAYYRNKTTFIQRDIDILSKHFEVDEIAVRKRSDIIKLAKKIKEADVVFIWFAGKHAGISVFLARLLGKKSLVVVGGYDAANVPEIGYGLWVQGTMLEKFLCKYSISHADFALPVSKFHEKEMLKIATPRKHEIVYNGVPDNFCRGEIGRKERKIATISILKKENIMRKGLLTYLRVAEHFPDYEFIIVGKPMDETPDILKQHAPANVKILGFLPHEELVDTLKKCSVYMQLSAYESFGIAVVEAMRCGCIPVVTNRGALPEVVGDAGIVVEYGDIENIAKGLQRAFEYSKNPDFIKKVKDRSWDFSLRKREEKLVKILRGV